MLDDQKPDLVVFTGDQLTGASKTPDDVRRAIDNIVRPVDERRIPWLVAFGNHDEDHTPRTGLDEAAMLKIYRSYPYNVNRVGPVGVTGTGNVNLLVRGSGSEAPAFAVWALDSGRYAPAKIAGQVLDEDALLEAILKAKPASAKGTYLKGVSVSSTMGPGVKIDPQVFGGKK